MGGCYVDSSPDLRLGYDTTIQQDCGVLQYHMDLACLRGHIDEYQYQLSQIANTDA